MSALFKKYHEIIMYLIFGVATTVINISIFYICNEFLGIDYRISNTIGWFISVLFAFVTNKYFVFSDNQNGKTSFFQEMLLFYWYRALSFVIDMGLIIICIEWLLISDFWSKIITQVVVIIVNYFFSKFFVFKNSSKKEVTEAATKK